MKTAHTMISMPPLENSSQRAAEGQIKVDVIQAEPVAAAEHTSLQNTIADQTGPIQINLGTKWNSVNDVSYSELKSVYVMLFGIWIFDGSSFKIKSISFFDFVLKYFNTFYEMQTNDGISFFDYRVNVDELDEKIKELRLEDYWNTIN